MSEQFVTVLNSSGATKTVPTIGSIKGYPVNIGNGGSIGMKTASVWMRRAQWTVPTGYSFRVCHASAAVTTSGSDTMIVTGKRFGTWSTPSDLWTPDQRYNAPFFASKLMGIVESIIGSANTIGLYYINQSGNSKHTRNLDTNAGVSGGTTFAASAQVGNTYEFILDAGDYGVREVTGGDDTHSIGAISVWGFNTILRTLGIANVQESVEFHGCWEIPEGDTIMLFMMGSITAQVRSAQLQGYLIPST